MAIYQLGDSRPQVHETAWVADSAEVIGDVRLAEATSVWYGSLLRGDSASITIGRGSNIQDHSVLHVDAAVPLVVGEDVTVGHRVVLHGCTIGDGSLIGIGAIVLNRACIGRHCLVGAGAVVTEDKTFPDGSLILGAPARAVRPLTPQQLARMRASASHYVAYAARHRATLSRIG